MEKFKAFLKRKNIVISAKRYGIDALGAMAQGLFCSLLIGTILDTLGDQFGVEFLVTVGGYASAMSGAAMAVAIGYALQAPPMVLFSLVTVGYAANALGSTTLSGGSGAGGGADGGSPPGGEGYTGENGHQGRHQQVDFGFLADGHTQLGGNDGDEQYRQGAACAAAAG